jgi:hypothetical protein
VEADLPTALVYPHRHRTPGVGADDPKAGRLHALAQGSQIEKA